jgi:hypothetical protein
MATPLLLNDVAISQQVFNFSNLQQTAVLNRYWQFVQQVSIGLITFTDLATAVDTLTATRWKAWLTDDAHYNGCRARKMYPLDRHQWEVVTTGAGAGGGGAIASPAQVCGLVTFRTPFIGKNAEGRFYAPFPPAAFFTGDGTISSAGMTILTALSGEYSTQLTVNGTTGGQAIFNPVVFNPTKPTALPPIITSGAPSTSFATQRRRGAYGRFNKPPF